MENKIKEYSKRKKSISKTNSKQVQTLQIEYIEVL